MRKLMTLAAAATLAMAFSPVCITTQAFAQSLGISSIVAMDHSMRTSKLIGMDVFNDQGVKVGKIEDVLVKRAASEPEVVLSVGGFTGTGDKMVAVPLSHLNLKNDKVSMAATKQAMMAMPDWKFTGLNGGGG